MFLLPGSKTGAKGLSAEERREAREKEREKQGNSRAVLSRVPVRYNSAVQTTLKLDLSQIAERLILQFDREPELKARVAQALLEVDHEQAA